MYVPPSSSTSQSPHLTFFCPFLSHLLQHEAALRYCSALTDGQTTPTLQPPESWQERERESDEGLRVRGICTILSAAAAHVWRAFAGIPVDP